MSATNEYKTLNQNEVQESHKTLEPLNVYLAKKMNNTPNYWKQVMT
jgi:hypothetical protein